MAQTFQRQPHEPANGASIHKKNLWVVWAMWAIKNFVRGPSAAVTFGARPYPGALKQTAIGHATCSRQPYNPYSVVLWWGAMWAVSTRPGGSLAGVMWPCGHNHARAFVDNVDNVVTRF